MSEETSTNTSTSAGSVELKTPPILEIQCAFCLAETKSEVSLDTKHCIKCTRPFCPEHSSKISPNACKECFSEFAAVVEKYTRIDEEYNEKTDSVVSHKSTSRRIRLDGPDYVWYSLAIQRLTDEELALSFQFHRFMVSLLEHVTTVRIVKKSNELAKMPSRGLTTSTTTEIRKTRKVKQQKSLREILTASGITDEVTLLKMLAAAGVKE